ncbi:MAG TPA: copper resistance protein B [Lysobacter sp.]
MKTRALTTAPLAAALLLSFNAAALDHSQHHQHQQPAPQEDHSQHQQPPMDHAAMGHTRPPAADQPVTPIPELTDADRAAAQPPANDHAVHDNGIFHFVQLNRLEAFDADGGNGLEWEGQAWIGRDRNKLWLRSEGERVDGRTESADLEALYGRAIAPWWDVVAGVRHDFKPGASQDFAAIGVMGVAPYKFEVEATAYVGQGGQTAARLEAEYELLLTNRLILQPLVEVNACGQNDARRSIGSGLSTAEAGLRLRYEITRQFAPYIGVVREWSFGRTADFRRDEGETVNDTRVVAGVRIWF